MPFETELKQLIESIPLADTHEHLVEEKDRMTPGDSWALHDFGVLFAMYPDSDLVSAGMSPENLKKALSVETSTDERWSLISPWWEKIRYTGYGQLILESIHALFNIDDLNDSNYQHVSNLIAKQIKPGYYETILQDLARIDHAQVNTMQHPFYYQTAHQDLFLQDLSILGLSHLLSINELNFEFDREIASFKDYLDAVDQCFEKYGPKAIAVKTQCAYLRELDFTCNDKDQANQIFQQLLKTQQPLDDHQLKPLRDYLFHYCVDKAVEYDLPVKMHTGYHAGHSSMPLSRVSTDPHNMCEICRAHPDANFLFMHITYPYWDEAITVAKQYPNAHVEMSWSWILNPLAAKNCLMNFIKSAPINKVFPFGGDHFQVELVPGHAAMARRGIYQSLLELTQDGWLTEKQSFDVAQQIMRQNAYDLFDMTKLNPLEK